MEVSESETQKIMDGFVFGPILKSVLTSSLNEDKIKKL